MKVFNVLFPYPEPISYIDDETTKLQSFYDKITCDEKSHKGAVSDCHPDILRDKVSMKNLETSAYDENETQNDGGSTIEAKDLLEMRESMTNLRT